MSKPQKVWMTRCMPGGTEDQLPHCQKDGIIAIGWSHVDLSRDGWEASDEVKKLSRNHRCYLRWFCEMEKGDWVLVPRMRGTDLHVAQITSDKIVNAEKDWARNGKANYYEARWQKDAWERSKMPADVHKRLKYPGTHLRLHDDYEQLRKSVEQL